MDHRYIDENSVAERYLDNALKLEEREAFERHLVDCQECADRILLAGMFHARLQNGTSPLATSHKSPKPPNNPPKPTPPTGLVVRLKPAQIAWILLISLLLLLAIPLLVRLFV